MTATPRPLKPCPVSDPVQYRVVWKRQGLDRKTKVYATRRGADRFISLLGPAPWEGLGREPDELYCCSGHECGCGGGTVRDRMLEDRKDMPPLESISLEQRPVGQWNALPSRAPGEEEKP